MNDTTRKTAWEVDTGAYALRALAGTSTLDEFTHNRHERAREMIATCGITPDEAGFEIGSGNGLVAKLLASKCAKLDCSDVSASFLNLAAKTCVQCPNVS